MDGRIIEDGEMLVSGGEIKAVGKDIALENKNEQISDLGQSVIMPGFINIHTHLEYTHAKLQSDVYNLWSFIKNIGYKKGCVPDYNLVLASSVSGALECALTGVTCVADSAFFGISSEAISKVGLRGIVYKEIFGQSFGDDYKQKVQEKISEINNLQSQSSSLIKIGISPHSIYTSNKEVLRLCAESGLPVSIHVAETREEEEYSVYGSGPIAQMRKELGYLPMVSGLSPVKYLKSIDFLKANVCLAHCVWLDEEDINIIAESRVSVAHCARSNAYLCSGVAPIKKMIDTGILLGIGTDSTASCMNLNHFEEMRFSLAIHRAAKKDSKPLLAKDILELSTIGGARALGLFDKIGSLESGKRADFIALDIKDYLPGQDIYMSVLSKTPSDVLLSVVDGVEVVRGGKHINISMQDCKLELQKRLEQL